MRSIENRRRIEVRADRARSILALNPLVCISDDMDALYRRVGAIPAVRSYWPIFLVYALQRACYAEQLRDLVRELGGAPWGLGLSRSDRLPPANLGDERPHAVLSACEAAEHRAETAYLAAVENRLPEPAWTTVGWQLGEIARAHRHLRMLRDLTTPMRPP